MSAASPSTRPGRRAVNSDTTKGMPRLMVFDEVDGMPDNWFGTTTIR